MAVQKVTGTLVAEKGNYYLEMPNQKNKKMTDRIQLPSSIDKKAAETLAGTKVDVILSEPQQFVAGIAGAESPILKKIKILCYMPRIDLVHTTAIDAAHKSVLANQFVDAGILSKETAEYLMK